MFKPVLIISYAALSLSLVAPVHGQSLLLQYDFDGTSTTTAADTGTGTPAPGNLVLSGSASGAGFVSGNTPSGTGRAFSTGDGSNNYLTTAPASDPDSSIGNVGKFENLEAFTLTLWVNLQSVAINDRFLSDGGAPSSNVNGFDLLVGGSGTVTANSFRLNLSVNGTSVSSSINTGAFDQWVFLAVTYDGTQTTNNVVFYRGTTASELAQLGTAVSLAKGSVGTNTHPFQIAGTPQAANNADRTPTGLFDDVRVYSGVADAAFLENVRLANVPEPSVVVALLSGTAFLGLLRRRRLS